MIMLTVQDVSAGYGDRKVLEKISFQLDVGLHILLGRNGSGKTTLFRAISGAVPSKSGGILLNGESLHKLSIKERAKRLAIVLGTHQTLEGITGEDLAEMAFYPRQNLFYKPGKKEKESVLHAAKEYGVEDLLERPLESMSAGERQTMELMTAILQDTPLLLLDEPTSTLDYNRTHEFLSKVKSISQKKIVLVTLHDPGLALRYADRILLIKEGQIAGDFAPSETSADVVEKMLRMLYPELRVHLIEDILTVI